MLYRRVEKLVITTTVNANHQTPLEPFLQASKSLKSNHQLHFSLTKKVRNDGSTFNRTFPSRSHLPGTERFLQVYHSNRKIKEIKCELITHLFITALFELYQDFNLLYKLYKIINQ